MKRKFKLLTSVASLCLAIALMVGGVFAATNPKLTVSGTVSFSAVNVFATVSAKETLPGGSETSLGDDFVYAAGTESKAPADEFQLNKDGGEKAGKVELDDVNVEYTYNVTITSNFATTSKATVIVNITNLPELPAGQVENAYSLSIVASGDYDTAPTEAAAAYTLKGGESVTLTVTFTVDPAKAETIENHNLGMAFNLTRGKQA